MTRLEKEIFDTCNLIGCGECPFHVKTRDFCVVGEPYRWTSDCDVNDGEGGEDE